MELDKRVTGKTRLIGIIGNPVEHSVSPMLHNSLCRQLGIDVIYVPFKVEKNDLDNAVKGLKAINILGFNITIPYKKEIMKYIDDNTKEALLMGAVNTVKNIDGRFYGYNTDAEGFSRSFKEESGTNFKDKKIVLIGAGGAARAIAVKMTIEGARKIYVVNRTESKAREFIEMINSNVKNIAEYASMDENSDTGVLKQSDIIINTTSVGMYPNIDESPIGHSDIFSGGQIVYDVVYNPSKTKFLSYAENKGCKTINGLGMLFYQGIFAFEIWTGIKLTEDVVKSVYCTFKNNLNI